MSRDPRDDGRAGAALACVLGLLLALPLAWPLFEGEVFSADDLGRFHLPLRRFYADCLARGDDFRWHPGLFCGSYVHGEGQAGMAHPLHRLIYASLPTAAAFQAEVAIGYPLLFLGMATWLRRLGLRPDSSWFGAIVFSFSGFVLLRYVHVNAVAVVAHVPWILTGIEAIARPRSSRGPARAAACVAILTASQGLLGYPQYLAFGLLVEGLYAAHRLGRSAAGWMRTGSAIGLGLLAAGAQIVPSLDALASSTRGRPDSAFLGMNSLHPWNLVQIVVPYAFRGGYYDDAGIPTWPRHEQVAYLGAVVPASLAWLWIRRRDLGARAGLARGAAVVGFLAIVLSLGRHSPLFPAYVEIPVARIFRAPSRFFLIAQLAAAVLAALAYQDLAKMSRRGGRLPRRAVLALFVPAGLSVAAWAAIPALVAARPSWVRAELWASGPELAASALWIVAPCAVFATTACGWRLGPLALIAIAAADSATYAVLPILRHERPVDPDDPSAFGPAPPAGSSGRVASTMNDSLMRGGRLVRGYVALTPRRSLDDGRPESLRVAGVEWVWSDDDRAWHRPPQPPLPRVRLVSRAVESRDVARDLAGINSAITALVDRPISLKEGPAGEAWMVEDRPGRITVSVDAPDRRLVVLSESYHAGWMAAIDGRPASVDRAYGDFLGCVVGPGDREVAFRFDPVSDRLGRWLSAVGLGGIALAWCGGRSCAPSPAASP